MTEEHGSTLGGREGLRAWLDRKPPPGTWRDFEPERPCKVVQCSTFGWRMVRE